jgi:hypothetical protein
VQGVVAKMPDGRFAAVKAVLSGGFVGEVRQKEGGAKFIKDGAEVAVLPPWQVGATLSFVLLGEKSLVPAMQGKVIAWVQTVASIQEEEQFG